MFLELSTELLSEGYGVRFRAIGQSMHPTIRDGEAVRVEPVKIEEIERGDIILYSAMRGLTAHRVMLVEIAVDGARIFQMRGDACVSFDEPATAEKILGRITEVERGGRKVSLKGRAARLRRSGRALLTKFKAVGAFAHLRRTYLSS